MIVITFEEYHRKAEKEAVIMILMFKSFILLVLSLFNATKGELDWETWRRKEDAMSVYEN